LKTNDFGNVPCNGLIVKNRNEAIVFDTPTNDKSAEELIKWIKGTLQCNINAVIPTHFHNDCLGGLNAFHENKIPSYAYFKTIELAKENKVVIPQNSFSDSLTLKVGNKHIEAKYFGEGHTKDNVVGYFPAENVLFGGCLIKEINASKGYLGDANIAAWSGTVEKIKKEYPNVQLVVPGHGTHGNQKLLDYTIKLFKPQ
jgi:metallo-beta-lactamase class B